MESGSEIVCKEWLGLCCELELSALDNLIFLIALTNSFDISQNCLLFSIRRKDRVECHLVVELATGFPGFCMRPGGTLPSTLVCPGLPLSLLQRRKLKIEVFEPSMFVCNRGKGFGHCYRRARCTGQSHYTPLLSTVEKAFVQWSHSVNRGPMCSLKS